ncbi:MAG: hypothetical protein LUF82_04015, partial [Clostridia bacterium]|nr:hypothetical protein [Clostridia bacterium]
APAMVYIPVYPMNFAPAPAPAPAMVYIPVYPMNFAPAPVAAGYGYPPAPAPAPAAPESVYKVKQVYCGPTDDFILKLEESEKIEFAKLFIEKVNGDYDNIPDYIVGGNNKAFFSALFIYLSQFRPLMSSGLMNKIYDELNLLNEENEEE